MRAVILTLLLATPALADPIPGLDDPAFRAPFERALQGDDPTALQEIHAAAMAGNTAAVLALPVVTDWLRSKVPFAERKTHFYVNGVPMPAAFVAADPVAALWAMGEPGNDMDALLARAFGLYDAGEADKATRLFLTWVNQTGGYQPLPEGFFDHPVPPWAMAQVLRGRLFDNGITPPGEGDALLVERLKADDPAAWIAIATALDLDHIAATVTKNEHLARSLKTAGIAPDDAVRRIQDVVPALKATSPSPEILDPETAKAATTAFRAEPEFQPLLTLCTSICPDTQDQCATAVVAGFGHPYGRASLSQPLTSLISVQDFFATPRGQLLLLRSTLGRLGDDPAASAALTAARAIDACLADAILSALP